MSIIRFKSALFLVSPRQSGTKRVGILRRGWNKSAHASVLISDVR
jgi:hypothetical protein